MSYRGEHSCVSCHGRLVPTRNVHCAYEICRRCGGIWIEELALLSLLRATPTAQHPDELMEHNDGTPHRPCPHCHNPMDIVWIDFLQLARCRQHGVWLDPGQLQRALLSNQPK